jgi:hypothetical protein
MNAYKILMGKSKRKELLGRTMRTDNVIPGMTAACRWDVESGKLMYRSM